MPLHTYADARLELLAQQSLEALPLADRARLRVTVVGGVCRVEGAVSSYQEKQAISRVLSRVPGIRALVNQVRIAPEELALLEPAPAMAEAPASGQVLTA